MRALPLSALPIQVARDGRADKRASAHPPNQPNSPGVASCAKSFFTGAGSGACPIRAMSHHT